MASGDTRFQPHQQQQDEEEEEGEDDPLIPEYGVVRRHKASVATVPPAERIHRVLQSNQTKPPDNNNNNNDDASERHDAPPPPPSRSNSSNNNSSSSRLRQRARTLRDPSATKPNQKKKTIAPDAKDRETGLLSVRLWGLLDSPTSRLMCSCVLSS